jgi:excisionase family DNA binding protein
MPTDLIGTAEACQILGVDKATISRWVADGDILPAHKLPHKNGAFLFHRADIDALAAQRNEANA